MATPAVDIDISAVLSEKSAGDTVSAAELGVFSLVNGFAFEDADGSIGVRSEVADDDGSPGALQIAVELSTTANARSGRFYVAEYELTGVRTADISAQLAVIWWRPNSTAGAKPWANMHFRNDGWTIAVNRRTDALATLNFSSSTSAMSKKLIRWGEKVKVQLVLAQDGSVANARWIAVFVNGIPCGFAYNMAADLTFSGPNSTGLAFTYVAGVEWRVTGNIRVYAVDSLDGIIVQEGAARMVLPLLSTLAAEEYGLTRVDHSGETETYVHLGVGTGLQSGDSWLSLAGTSSSGVAGVNSTLFSPPDAIGFSSDGALSVTVQEFSVCADGSHRLALEDADGNEIAGILFDDTGATADLSVRVDGGAWVPLASDVDIANCYRARVILDSAGGVSFLVKDVTDSPVAGGGFWGTTLNRVRGDVPVAVRSVRTRTSESSGTMLLGAVRWGHRPTIWLACDSWSDAAYSSAPEVHQQNHYARSCHGGFVAARSGVAGDEVTPGGISFRIDGSGGFGHSGASIEEWREESAAVWPHVRYQVVVLGVSIMNTAMENEAAIAGTAEERQAVLDAMVEDYSAVLNAALAGRNRVAFVLPLPVPETAAPGTTWADNEVTRAFILDANTALLKLCRGARVPAGSALCVLDPYTQLVADEAYDGLTWDAQDLHLASDDPAWAAAVANVSLEGVRVGGGSRVLGGRVPGG